MYVYIYLYIYIYCQNTFAHFSPQQKKFSSISSTFLNDWQPGDIPGSPSWMILPRQLTEGRLQVPEAKAGGWAPALRLLQAALGVWSFFCWGKMVIQKLLPKLVVYFAEFCLRGCFFLFLGCWFLRFLLLVVVSDAFMCLLLGPCI